MSVANIWKHSGAFCKCTRWLRNFIAKGWFRSAAKLAFSLLWSASNGSNFFISTPIHAPFEALDFWLPKIWNDIWYASNGLWEVLQKCQTVDVHLNSSCCFHPCILDLFLAKDYKAPKLDFFMLMSFQLLCHGFLRTLLDFGLLWWSNYYQKHQNLHNLIRNDCLIC